MRQVQADKYNVAWFKLAEFVARGEKERALALYRLLVHSFNDRALALQLEGDLLLSFNDANSIEKYLSAATLYKQEGRIREAIAVYEHLITLHPQQEDFRFTILDLYTLVAMHEHMEYHIQSLIHGLLKQRLYEPSIKLIERFKNFISDKFCIAMYQQFVYAAAKDPNAPQEITLTCLDAVVDWMSTQSSKKQLQAFLSDLEELNMQYYQHAYRALKPN